LSNVLIEWLAVFLSATPGMQNGIALTLSLSITGSVSQPSVSVGPFVRLSPAHPAIFRIKRTVNPSTQTSMTDRCVRTDIIAVGLRSTVALRLSEIIVFASRSIKRGQTNERNGHVDQ